MGVYFIILKQYMKRPVLVVHRQTKRSVECDQSILFRIYSCIYHDSKEGATAAYTICLEKIRQSRLSSTTTAYYVYVQFVQRYTFFLYKMGVRESMCNMIHIHGGMLMNGSEDNLKGDAYTA
jgi:hypothetical protein